MNVYSLFFVCLGLGFGIVSVPCIVFELWMIALEYKA